MRINLVFGIIILLLICSLAAPSGSNAAIAATLAAIVLLIIFYRSVLKSTRSIINGAELLKSHDFSSRLAHVGQHEADKIIDMFNSMISALRNERLRLLEQNHMLTLLTDVSPTGVITLDDKGLINTANGAAAEYLGYETADSMQGLSIDNLDSQLGRILAKLNQGDSTIARLSNSMIYRCSKLHFMDNGYSHPFILIEKLTDEIIKAERRSYATVIRIIAHEVNNSMAGVDSLLATTAQSTTDPEVPEIVDVCRDKCHSLSRFITAYADVVKIPPIQPVTVDINECIASWRLILESLCTPSATTLTLRLDPRPVKMTVDTVLFEQVMINIVKNSVESMGARSGEITITTTATPPTITISDNGAGIDPTIAPNLFSPFFTTKPNGQGIGLMFISEVLRRHNFRFSLTTDTLTRFVIKAPV